MRKALMLGTTVVLWACGHTLHAQEQNGSDLDPITITTSLTPEKASRSGRNLMVIQSDQISTLPVHTIDELLRYLPGVEIQSRGPFGSQSDIIIRGGTFQQVLVILDGLRLNDPVTGHFTGYLPLAPSEIERIEILKGASSAQYGSEAVGGVIHIITKTFAAKTGIWKSQVQAQVTGGQHNLFSMNAGGFFTNGRTAINAGILSNNTSGEPKRGTHGSVYANTVSFSLNHHFNEHWSLSMRYAYEDRSFDAQNFYTSFLSDTASEQVTTFWNQLTLACQKKKNRISLLAGYKDLQDEYRYNEASISNINNSKLIQALLTDELKLNKKINLVAGAQFLSKRIVSNDRGIHRIDQYAGFTTLNVEVGKKIFASPALRLEWNQRSGLEWIPQLNLCYASGALRIRGSAGKTIRDGDFTERFNNYGKPWVTGGTIGNPDLKAERALSYEVGSDYFGIRNLKISTTLFSRQHQNMIDYVITPYNEMPRRDNLSPSGIYALARNIYQVSTRGWETELMYSQKLKGEKQLTGTFGFTWVHTVSPAEASYYISSHARILTSFTGQYSTKRFQFALNGVYKQRTERLSGIGLVAIDPHYFLFNARAEAFLIRNQLSLFLQADNVLNQRYADLLGAQMPGRWLMTGIKISLSKISDDARPFGTAGNFDSKWWYINR